MSYVTPDGARRRPEPEPVVVPMLTSDQLQVVIALALRNQALYREAREFLLHHDTFRLPAETLFVLAITAFDSAWNKIQGPPPYEIWYAELSSYAAVDSLQFPPSVVSNAQQYAHWVCGLSDEYVHSYEGYARQELSRFLVERQSIERLRQQLTKAKVGMLEDPTNVMERARVATSRIVSMASPAPVISSFPSVQYRQVVKHPTGVRAIDEIMGGGFETRQVYGLFGPSGAFKTGFAAQITANIAMTEMARYRMDPNYVPGTCFYAVYEGGAEEIQPRVVAAAADMPRTRALQIFSSVHPDHTDQVLGSRPGEHEYERVERMTIPERERWAYARNGLSTLQILDMSGADPMTRKPNNSGKGGVEEIAGCIDRYVQAHKTPVRLVVIDYAKLMAKRYMTAKGIREDSLRHVLSAIPDTLRRLIADPYDCTVLVVQQLNTSANKRAAGSAMSHVDSSEAGDFGENLWYCFCLSAVNTACGSTVQLTASKTRHSQGSPYGTVLRINPNTNKLVDTDDYVIDTVTHRIIPRAAYLMTGDPLVVSG